jgi:hypothetical protein
MPATCPKCEGAIDPQDINIGTDTAMCRACHSVLRVTALVEDVESGPFDINCPPKGAWFRDDAARVVVGATMGSPVAGCIIVGFVLIWITMLSLMATGIVPISPSQQGQIPLFLMMSCVPMSIMVGVAAFCFGARVEVAISGGTAEVFTGVGVLGWRRCVDWQSVTRVSLADSGVIVNGGRADVLTLEGARRVKFGLLLTTERQRFIKRALTTLLAPPPDSGSK